MELRWNQGVRFRLAPAQEGKPNAVVSRGQTIALPSGRFNRLYVLAASADGDQKASFRVGGTPVDTIVQDWGGYIGQWDNRTWNVREVPVTPRAGAPTPAPGAPPRTRTVLEHTGLTPGFIKRAPVAWFASHRHAADGANEPYAYAYLFAHSFALPANARSLTLPDNDTRQPCSAASAAAAASPEKQCRITATPPARERSTSKVSSSESRMWITSGLPARRAISICASNARRWSARGAPSR